MKADESLWKLMKASKFSRIKGSTLETFDQVITWLENSWNADQSAHLHSRYSACATKVAEGEAIGCWNWELLELFMRAWYDSLVRFKDNQQRLQLKEISFANFVSVLSQQRLLGALVTCTFCHSFSILLLCEGLKFFQWPSHAQPKSCHSSPWRQLQRGALWMDGRQGMAECRMALPVNGCEVRSGFVIGSVGGPAHSPTWQGSSARLSPAQPTARHCYAHYACYA